MSKKTLFINEWYQHPRLETTYEGWSIYCCKDEIQQMIRNSDNLHEVEIGSARELSIEFVQECLEAIARKGTVRELTLRRFGAAAPLSETFIERLAQIRCVKELNLMGLSNEQIRLFMSWAVTTANLTKLQIINTFVDTTCLRHVGEFIAASTTIRQLFMCVEHTVSDEELLTFYQRCLNNYSLCYISLPCTPFYMCDMITSRNRSIQWPTVFSEMREAVIGLFPFQLPLYIMLWIIDWFPYIAVAHKEHKKVAALQLIYASCDAAAARRRVV